MLIEPLHLCSFRFASRLLAWFLSRILKASVGLRVAGCNCLRDITMKFQKVFFSQYQNLLLSYANNLIFPLSSLNCHHYEATLVLIIGVAHMKLISLFQVISLVIFKLIHLLIMLTIIFL